MIDLEPYIEQLALVPDKTVCTVDVEILRAFVIRTADAEAALDRVRVLCDTGNPADYWQVRVFIEKIRAAMERPGESATCSPGTVAGLIN